MLEGSRRWQGKLVVFVAVNLLAIAVRLAFFSGYQGHDDAIYMSYAREFAASGGRLDSEIKTQWIGRVANWMPVSLAFSLGSNPAFAMSWFHWICSVVLLNTCMSFACARFDLRTAAIAGVLLATFPLDVIYSTTCYPDVPVSLWIWISLLCIGWNTTSKYHPWLQFLAGLSFGLACEFRETAILTLLPLAFIALPMTLKDLGKFSLRFGAGVLLILILELAFFQIQTGDALFRIHALSSRIDAVVPAVDRAENTGLLSYIPRPQPKERRFQSDFFEVAYMLFMNEEFGLFMYLAIPILIWGFVKRQTETRVLRIFALTLMLLLLYAPVLRGNSLMRDPRYFCPIIAPLAVCVAWTLRTSLTPRLQIAATAVLVTSSLVGLWATQPTRSSPSYKQLNAFRLQHSDVPFWVSPKVAGFVSYHSKFANEQNLNLLLLESPGSKRRDEYLRHRRDVTVAEDVDAVWGGYAVVTLANEPRLPANWRETLVIEPPLTVPGRVVMRILEGVGAPAMIRDRLRPPEDSLRIYKVE